MPTTLSTKAVEQSTFVVSATFTDENGDSVVPNTLQWSLVDRKGNVVNDRKDVSVSSPSSTEDIVLSSADLKIDKDREQVSRWVVFEGTYDSTLGSDLPLKDQVEFTVVNLKKVR